MCERSTPTQRISLGIARAAFDDAFNYVRQPEAFGGKIIDFQGVQWCLAEAAAEIDRAELICYQAARDLDSGGEVQGPPPRPSCSPPH